MSDRGPVNRCGVKACAYVGHWPEGGCCPYHALPHTDKPIGRAPTLDESWEADQ